jgi:hypothetical protein
LNEPRLDSRVLHGAGDCRAAAMHDNRPHAYRFHEHDVDQQVSQRFWVLHHAATQLDDRDLVAELADPTHRFDEEIRLLDSVVDHGFVD